MSSIKNRFLTLDEITYECTKAKIDLLGILREMHGTVLRIAAKDNYNSKLRALAKDTAAGIMNEIHELKIELEGDALGEVPF
jgi:uncharacterized metal-binding protein